MKAKTKKYELTLEHPFGLARSVSTTRTVVFSRLECNGLTGLGEAPSRYYGETLEGVIESIERDAAEIREGDIFFVKDIMRRTIEKGLTTGSACAALDMAIYDLIGKTLNIPVYKLFGAKPREELLTSYTIGIDTVDIMLEKVEEAGEFPILKIKMGRDVNQDIEVIKEIRKMTDKIIRVDANGGWSFEEAKKCISILAELGVEYVEQPLDRGELKKNAELKHWSPLPIFLDEDVHTSKDIPQLAEVCDGVNIKLMKCGGITEALRMVELSRALGLQLMLGCMVESSLAITAGAQIATFFDYLDLDGNLLITNDPFDGVQTIRGNLKLPDRPGLGVVPKEELFDDAF